jgi:CheY-like chemotaxis protein
MLPAVRFDSKGALSMRKMLVVDDIPTHRFMLAALLSNCTCEVFTADSGEAALKLSREVQPDVVFLDLTMPEMDGYALARNLRADAGLRDIRLVAVSAWDCDQQRLDAAGINQYLRKPVMLQDVCTAGGVTC